LTSEEGSESLARGGMEAGVRGYMVWGVGWRVARFASVSVQLFPLVTMEESV
jgi:hypothetical protein